MTGSPERGVQHRTATLYPVAPEDDIVDLMRVITSQTRRYGRDHVLREGVAELIEGALTLLNGEWGPRLDLEIYRADLRIMAERIGYDIDSERFANSPPLPLDFPWAHS
jgi:hypothetical protein